MDNKTTPNLTHQRAAFAYSRVSEWGKPWRARALAIVKGLPVSLRTLGLTVLLAMLIRGNSAHERELIHILSRWLLEKAPQRPLSQWFTESQGEDVGKLLLRACLKADRASYLAAQTEALALLEQVKLFAEALYGDSHGESVKENASV
jgi:hypothetical protein